MMDIEARTLDMEPPFKADFSHGEQPTRVNNLYGVWLSLAVLASTKRTVFVVERLYFMNKASFPRTLHTCHVGGIVWVMIPLRFIRNRATKTLPAKTFLPTIFAITWMASSSLVMSLV